MQKIYFRNITKLVIFFLKKSVWKGGEMALENINYLAVLVAAVISMGMGAAWYSKALFGKQWMKLSGISQKDIDKQKGDGMAKSYAIAFLGSLVTAFVLAIFIEIVGAITVVGGIKVGFLVWLGFVATTTLGSILWENKPQELYALNNGYNLLSLATMGAILAAWP